MTRENEVTQPAPDTGAGTELPTLAELHGSVPDLVPNPVSSEAWVRRFRDGYDAGYEAALASRAVPVGERHADCATMDDVVREVFCRVFGDDGAAGMAEQERWREWYKPSDWLWWGRGLGAFLYQRLRARAVPPAGQGEASFSAPVSEKNEIAQESEAPQDGREVTEAQAVALERIIDFCHTAEQNPDFYAREEEGFTYIRKTLFTAFSAALSAQGGGQ